MSDFPGLQSAKKKTGIYSEKLYLRILSVKMRKIKRKNVEKYAVAAYQQECTRTHRQAGSEICCQDINLRLIKAAGLRSQAIQQSILD